MKENKKLETTNTEIVAQTPLTQITDNRREKTELTDAEIKEMDCEIKKGTRRDAIIFSVGSNDKHGLRRNNADKENAVLKLLGDPEWSVWSDNMIAQKCKVSNHLVKKEK